MAVMAQPTNPIGSLKKLSAILEMDQLPSFQRDVPVRRDVVLMCYSAEAIRAVRLSLLWGGEKKPSLQEIHRTSIGW